MFLPAANARAQELMPANSSAWSAFAPRPQSAPATLASAGGTGYTLEILGNGGPSVYGGWRTRLQGLSGGAFYRFRARALPTEIGSPRESITILLRWRGAFGDRVAPDYVWEYGTQADGTLLFDRTLQAPPGTSAVDVELVLQWASNGRVAFDALSFTRAAAPAPRPVKLAAVNFRPSGTSSGLDSVQRAARYGEEVAATHRPDVMVFGELLNVIGAPGTFDNKAETVPGPSTDVMASLASAYSVNVVFGVLERQNGLLYNTAVLIDRSGNITGKYRKVQLPQSEVASGVTPGSEVPVFQTDFGRVALLICQDTAFPEPARDAAIQGAELLLVPIWGGKPALLHARAIEQSAYVVASGYDYLSEVVDPLGTVLDRVDVLGQPGVAVATIDLSHRFREDWIGDWRDVSNKERRIAPYMADETSGGNEPPPPPPNVAPAVTLTSPASGSSYTAPATVTLSANATDSDGTIARVDFYAGATLIATDTTSPYSASWSNVPAGSHTLTARATDNAGATTTSVATSITVTPGSGTSATEVVLYAAAATRAGSGWTVVADASAAGGSRLQSPNAGAAKVTTAAASPATYAELTFTAEAGKPYRLWVRGRAQDNYWGNDSIHVQFDGAVDASGTPIYRIGTSAAAPVNLEDCSGCGLSGWGWQDNGYGAGVLGPPIYFATTGTQRLRIQVREDGYGLDQIVLSAQKYLTTAPGALKNDATIIPR
jgi:predicted amidohydrolase